MISRHLLAGLLSAGILASSCSKEASAPAASSGAPKAEEPASASKPASSPDPCSLVTAEEIGAVLKRKMVSSSSGSGCEYGNAPESSSGTTASQMPQGIATLTNVKLDLARDNMTEAQVKAIYARTGDTVRRSLDPEKRGVQGAIVVANDIPKVGDWAFTTNVAAVNMGFGFSSRGRILHARKGPWHLTVGVTISPDPGETALDAQLGEIARTAISRLP